MYTEQSLVGALVPDAGIGVQDLTASPAVLGQYLIGKRIKVNRLKFHVTAAVVADTVAPVVEFNARPTPGSGASEVLLGQLTIPDGAAVGSVYYKNIEPVELPVGHALSCELAVQADNADALALAGAGYYSIDSVVEEETAANESRMILSV